MCTNANGSFKFGEADKAEGRDSEEGRSGAGDNLSSLPQDQVCGWGGPSLQLLQCSLLRSLRWQGRGEYFAGTFRVARVCATKFCVVRWPILLLIQLFSANNAYFWVQNNPIPLQIIHPWDKVTLRSNKIIWVCILCRKKQVSIVHKRAHVNSDFLKT